MTSELGVDGWERYAGQREQCARHDEIPRPEEEEAWLGLRGALRARE